MSFGRDKVQSAAISLIAESEGVEDEGAAGGFVARCHRRSKPWRLSRLCRIFIRFSNSLVWADQLSIECSE
jgi:hypothetical protein